jgi:uncharacterized protein YndB with AHSA1/START domain
MHGHSIERPYRVEKEESNMARNDYTVEIKRPTKDIFPMLHGTNLTQWVQGLVRVEQQGDMRVGMTFKHVYQDRGIDYIELDGEITAYEPNQRLAYTTVAEQNSQGFTTKAEYRLHERGGSTQLDYRSESTYRGFFVRLMSPIVTLMGQRQLKKDMIKLKGLLENPHQ